MKHHRILRTPRAALSRGFTLIEIIIVLTILVILAGGSIYMLKGLPEAAKEQRVESDLSTISAAIQAYEMRNMRPPTTDQGIKALVEKPTTEPIPERWMAFSEDIPKDPWGQEYKYRYPAQKSKKSFDVWSVGADGQDGTADDLGNWKATEAK
jgi:general secretion pathway protein G